MHTGRLVLTPRDPYFVPSDMDRLIGRLQDLEFISATITDQEPPAYLLGDRFMQLVTFMGCSPFIRLEPNEENQPFCHFAVLGPFAAPRFILGKNTRPPNCPACRKRVAAWVEILDLWRKDPDGYQTTCPHCGSKHSPVKFNWRQTAGVGRIFFYVENIFPSEAIPSEDLLQALRDCDPSAQAWNYFYIQDD